MRRLITAIMGVGILAAPLSSSAGGDSDALLHALTAAQQDVQRHFGKWDDMPDATVSAREAVTREWAILEELIGAKLSANRSTNLDFGLKDLSVAVVPLQPDTDLVSAEIDGLGTVFVAQRKNGAYRPVWRIGDLSASTIAAYPSLAVWSAANATHACPRSSACGPMSPFSARLPDDAEGRPRFYINASYSEAMGIEVGYQLSIWTWAGDAAVPALAGTYEQSLEVPTDLQVREQTLSLRAKDDFQTFFVTAPEPGRQMIWTISLAGTGARDLGRKSAVPELDIVDEMFGRILQGKQSNDLASAQARSVLQRETWKAIDDAGPGEVSLLASMGELWTSDVRRSGSNTALCFASDNIGPLRFDMKQANGRLFITHVKFPKAEPGNPEACGK